MNKKFLKLLTVLVTALLAVSVLMPANGLIADTAIAINATNFPDANFRKYVKSEFDQDSNGKLSDEEISDADLIDLTGKSIKDLTGLKYFTSLQILECSGLKLAELDVSSNTKLTTLIADGNKLSKITLTKNTSLTELILDDNKLSTLNVSKNISLKELSVAGNSLTKLDLANNTSLQYLDCSDNSISSITYPSDYGQLTTMN